MTTRPFTAAALFALSIALFGQAPQPPAAPAAPAPARDIARNIDTRFEAIDIYIDSGAQPLAAYQVELRATSGDVKAVGIEGGDPSAFKQAPYYDPAALHDTQLKERIVIAAFNTGHDLPTGRTRVARLHVQARGDKPEFSVKLETAGATDGSRIDAKVEIVPSK